jgi:nicotinic acid mononucleotide adenylyltransferase
MSSERNTIIFTLARMNPPTPGHLYVVQRLIETALEKNADKVYVILSKTNDNNENPIDCESKRKVLGSPENTSKTMIQSLKEKMIKETSDQERKSQIENIKVNTVCVPDERGATPFTPLGRIIKGMNDVNLFLVIGDDRKNMLDSITDTFMKPDGNVQSVDGEILPREEMGEYKSKSKDPEQLDKLVISEVPVNAMSASFVRNIVKNDRKDKFTELYEPYLENSKIDTLYEEVKSGLSKPPNTKPEGKVQDLKYTYPAVRGQTELFTRKRVKTEKTPKTEKTETTKKTRTIKVPVTVEIERVSEERPSTSRKTRTTKTTSKIGGKRTKKNKRGKKLTRKNKRKTKY